MPSKSTQDIMCNILSTTGQVLPHALFIIDGTHKRCLGKQHKKKRSWKFHWRAAKSFMFIIDRLTSRVCAISLGHAPSVGDLQIYRESKIGRNEHLYIFPEYPILADCGYVGANPMYMAFMVKRNRRATYNRAFVQQHQTARVQIEQYFGNFFRNQFPRLRYWFATGKKK